LATWRAIHETSGEAVERFLHNEEMYDNAAFEAERLKGVVAKQGEKIRKLEDRLTEAIHLIDLLAKRGSEGEYSKTLYKNIN